MRVLASTGHSSGTLRAGQGTAHRCIMRHVCQWKDTQQWPLTRRPCTMRAMGQLEHESWHCMKHE